MEETMILKVNRKEQPPINATEEVKDYRESVKNAIHDAVTAAFEEQIKQATQELIAEQRKAILELVEEHKMVVSQVVEEEKKAIHSRAEALRSSILKLGL
jgi:vacuolar-type H+-ATPase catalytic subunit A/Vma1